MLEVTPHIFVETGFMGSNVGCIRTPEGLVTVDCPILPREIDDWKKKISEISKEDIIYSIITDFHFDHALTAGQFCSRIIGHKIAYKGLKVMIRDKENLMVWFFGDEYTNNQDFFDRLDIFLPQIMFSQELILNLGGYSIELSYMGGHTPATILVHIPEEKVVFMGDNLTNGEFPFTGDGYFRNWIDSLNRVEQMDVDTIVPGHGDICDKQAIRQLKSYFEGLWDQVNMLRQEGMTKEEVASSVIRSNSMPLWNTFSMIPDLEEQLATDARHMYDQMEKELL